MIINFIQPLVNIDGVAGDTYQTFAKNAILAPNKNQSFEQNMDRYALAQRINHSTTEGIELSHVEIKMIKEAVHLVFSSPEVDKGFDDLFKEVTQP